MIFVGVSLNPFRTSLAIEACPSVSYSTNAMPVLPGTIRTSLNPGYLKYVVEGYFTLY